MANHKYLVTLDSVVDSAFRKNREARRLTKRLSEMLYEEFELREYIKANNSATTT